MIGMAAEAGAPPPGRSISMWSYRRAAARGFPDRARVASATRSDLYWQGPRMFSVQSAQAPRPYRQALFKTIWRGSDRVDGATEWLRKQVRHRFERT